MKFVLLILVIASGVVLAVLNPGSVDLDYWFGKGTLPLIYVLAIAFILGMTFAYLVGLFSNLKWRKAAHKWRRQAENTQQELNTLCDTTKSSQ